MMMMKSLTFTKYNKLSFFATFYVSVFSSNSNRHSQSHCHNLQVDFVGLLWRRFIKPSLATARAA